MGKAATWKSSSKYRPDFPQKTYDILAKGGTRAKVCMALGCANAALESWMQIHPDFREAWDNGMIACQAYWEDFTENAVGDQEINNSALRMLLINRVGFTDKRKIKFDKLKKAKTAEERVEAVYEVASENGGLTTGELKDITGSAKDLNEISSLGEMARDVHDLKTNLASRDSEAQGTGSATS